MTRRELILQRKRKKELLRKLEAKRWREWRFNRNVFKHPNGRICLISLCPDCNRFCLNQWWSGKRFGEVDNDKCPRRMDYNHICSECEANNEKYTPIESCDHCGRFQKRGWTGVEYRTVCNSTLCVGCWNRARRLWEQGRAVQEVAAQLRQFKRAITSLQKGNSNG